MSIFLKEGNGQMKRVMQLIGEHKKPVIYGRLNYPGEEKYSLATFMAYSQLVSALKGAYKDNIIEIEQRHDEQGSSVLMVCDEDVWTLKEKAIWIEDEHYAGKMFDIGVHCVTGEVLDRAKFEIPKRVCPVCSAVIEQCDEITHQNMVETIKYMDSMVDLYM